MNNYKNMQRGFTLLEILIVLTIIALSLSFVFPRMFSVLKTSDDHALVWHIVRNIVACRWKAFKRKKIVIIYEDNGKLFGEMGGKKTNLWEPSEGVSLNMKDTLICMPNGAVNGVTFDVTLPASVFRIILTPFNGEPVVRKIK